MAGINRIDLARTAGPGVGVVGYGFMGKVHSNAYLKIPYSFASPAAVPRLHALCGRNAAKAEDMARRLGYEWWYSDWMELVRDPEVRIVDVCTPDNEHCAPSIGAAEAGKHVLCEKPLAMTVGEARSMAEAVRKAGVKNMLCHNYRFIPAVRLARELIASGGSDMVPVTLLRQADDLAAKAQKLLATSRPLFGKGGFLLFTHD